MSESTFRVVIIGAGAITRVAHMPAAIASKHVELVGIVDPDTGRAKQLCHDYGVKPDIASNAGDLACSFDGVIVAAPNDLHAPVAKSMLSKGIPVLIEKPIATSPAEADELVELSNRHDVVCAVGYHTRHSGACRTLKHAIDSGNFGETLHFAHQDGSRGGWSPLSGYNLDLNRAGGGVLVSTGTHFLDRMMWLWGRPSTFSLNDNAGGGPESHCIARFDYNGSNGSTSFSGAAFFSKLVNLAENTVVETSEGLLIMASDAAEDIVFRPRNQTGLEYRVQTRPHRNDPRALYQRQLEDFAFACMTNTSPCVDAAAGAESMKLLNELYAGRQPIAAWKQTGFDKRATK